MPRKQRPYIPPKKKGPPPPVREYVVPPTVAVIDNRAILGRGGIATGMRVRILGTGLYAGEIAVVEELAAGPIPAALVRTEAGKTRRVRTIDLEPAAPGDKSASASAAPADDADAAEEPSAD